MKNAREELAVQSYCFRGFDTNEEVAERTKECGLSRVELCGAHADFSNTADFRDIIKTYRDGGIEIVSIGVQPMADQEEEERKYFEFLKEAGASFMSVDFALDTVPESYRTAEKLAEEYDVHLAIHNHGGRHWLGSSAMLEHVFADTDERIGLCLDTAWALDSGENPIEMARQFGDRLYGLHVKDFVFDSTGEPEDVVVGTGNVDLRELKNALQEVGFAGFAALEYEGDVDNPLPALSNCVEKIRKEWQNG